METSEIVRTFDDSEVPESKSVRGETKQLRTIRQNKTQHQRETLFECSSKATK